MTKIKLLFSNPNQEIFSLRRTFATFLLCLFVVGAAGLTILLLIVLGTLIIGDGWQAASMIVSDNLMQIAAGVVHTSLVLATIMAVSDYARSKSNKNSAHP